MLFSCLAISNRLSSSVEITLTTSFSSPSESTFCAENTDPENPDPICLPILIRESQKFRQKLALFFECSYSLVLSLFKQPGPRTALEFESNLLLESGGRDIFLLASKLLALNEFFSRNLNTEGRQLSLYECKSNFLLVSFD
jgi:hypothetical protein